jgi:hypothetical protein
VRSGATRDNPILSSALPPGVRRLGDYTTRAAMGGVKQQNLAATPVMALLGLTLGEARKKAREIQVDVDHGRDPAGVSRALREAPTFAEVAEE